MPNPFSRVRRPRALWKKRSRQPKADKGWDRELKNSLQESPERASEGTWQDRPVRKLHRRLFRSRKKGGRAVGKTKRGKGTKVMAVADRSGLPIAIHIAPAAPHEVTLVEATLASRVVLETPQRLIADRAYDSDPLDEKLRAEGIELIAPHKSNRVRPTTQDGRKLRRYRRRWKIERLNPWL